MKLQSKESDLEAASFQKDEMGVKLLGLEEKNTQHKQKILTLERKLVELESQKDFIQSKDIVQSHKIQSCQDTITVLN